MSRLMLLTLCSMLFAGLLLFQKKTPSTIAAGNGLVISKEWLKPNKKPITPIADRRPADQTFLTFPEWFLVFSPEEQANYFRQKTSTTFPFRTHIAQIWDSYRIVNNQIKEDFPVNRGYHFMIWVIASSSTVEYGMKALYETLIGRLTNYKEVVTAEDQFNAQFARSYVDFIKDRPWYEFDFKSQLGKLWATPFWGSHFLRKLERKYMLTCELIVKYAYGKLIGMGTQTVYGAALPTTVVVVDKVPANFATENIIQIFPDQSAIIKLPRYDKFNSASMELAKAGVVFKEIAGNTSAILITVLTDAALETNYNNAQTVFTQPISSNRALKRIAFAIPVSQLSGLLKKLSEDGIEVEHVFDF